MPRLVAVTLTAAVLVLLAPGGPASAKGPESATVSGPGIATMKVSWSHPDGRTLRTLLDVTRFWDGAGVAAWQPDAPSGDLGPAFTVTYHVYDAEPIRQNLYPYAAVGPVVHMPEGQTMYDIGMPYGWLATDHRLVRVVERLGGTSPPAPPRIEPAAHEATTSGGGGGPGWSPVAWGAVGALLLATAFGWRRQRVRRRA